MRLLHPTARCQHGTLLVVFARSPQRFGEDRIWTEGNDQIRPPSYFDLGIARGSGPGSGYDIDPLSFDLVADRW